MPLYGGTAAGRMEEEMDVSQYLEIFLDETNEHLQNLNTQILELESDP